MQIRNNYDILWTKEGEAQVGAGIFNGDIGTIQEISFRDECMRIAFDDRLAEYSFTLLQDLELAYAMTVHKSQGSESRQLSCRSCRAQSTCSRAMCSILR